MFLPGLAEIKMLYEQLQSNRMFNNRGSTRSVALSLNIQYTFPEKKKLVMFQCNKQKNTQFNVNTDVLICKGKVHCVR